MLDIPFSGSKASDSLAFVYSLGPNAGMPRITSEINSTNRKKMP